MKINNVMLFSYNFTHKKTQDFIFRLLIENYNIKYVIAAPWKKLNSRQSSLRVSPEHTGLIHPKKICDRFHIGYKVFEHNSKDTIKYLNEHPVDLYIISGARILSKEVIVSANNMIINIHPALLPEIRGVDTVLWSIYRDVPIGISSHFIVPNVDSGLLIYKEKLTLKLDDTLIDISLRLLEKQSDILIKTLELLKKKKTSSYINLDLSNNTYNKQMPRPYEKNVLNKLQSWLEKYTK